MRIGRLKKTTTYTTFRKKTESKIQGAYTVEGTDLILVKTRLDSIWYAYSKNTYFCGDRTRDSKLNNNLYREGWQYSLGIYSSSDFERVFSRIKNSTLTRERIENTIKKCCEKTTLSSGIQKNPEYGVELELESEDYKNTETLDEMKSTTNLIDNIGSDPSVHRGCEIRFNHPAISGWKYKEIALLLNKAKSMGFETTRGTAGMHIHISRNDIKQIITKFKDNLETMQEILYPINCRKITKADGEKMYFGVNSNIFRDQFAEFGTLEIRAWNATLNPRLFLARIKFCKYFCDWLAKTKTITVENFFSSLGSKEKANYKYMLNNKENPHEWGFPPKAVNALLA